MSASCGTCRAMGRLVGSDGFDLLAGVYLLTCRPRCMSADCHFEGLVVAVCSRIRAASILEARALRVTA
jgi:hypothetical protein